MKTTEFKSDNKGSAKSKAEAHLTSQGFKRRGPEDRIGDYWDHPNGKKVYVTHRKVGYSYIDESFEISSLIAEKIIDHIVEGTAGDTNLIDERGRLTHRGYAAMYAWKKAGHRGMHPSIHLERKAKGIKGVRI